MVDCHGIEWIHASPPEATYNICHCEVTIVGALEECTEVITSYQFSWIVPHKLLTLLVVPRLHWFEHRFVQWLRVIGGVRGQAIHVN